jgi:hypothetical protein
VSVLVGNINFYERGIFKKPATLAKLQEDTVMDSTVIKGGHTHTHTDIGL